MKKVLLSIFGVFTVLAVSAQDDISKQMDVTKAYTPKVGQAAKLAVEPRMVDTVQLRPQIDYSITPTAWRTAFSSEKYEAARMSVVPFEKNRPLYVRAGFGIPLQSTADVYFNPYTGPKSTFGMFLNHRGSYSNIENELGAKPNSTEMLNGVGLYGSRLFKNNRRLSGDVEYDNRLYHAYGVVSEDLFPFPANDPAFVKSSFTEREDEGFAFGRLRGSVAFGDSFTNLDRFNYQVGLNLGASHHSDVGFYQYDIDGWVKTAKMFNRKHGFEAGIYERGVIEPGTPSSDIAVTVMFRPRYLLSLDKFSLKAGFDLNYVYNTGYGQDYIGIAPHVEAALNIANGYFMPYFNLTSTLVDGSPEALSRRNPYAFDIGATGWTHDLRLGFSGSAGGVFSYNVYGGVSLLEDYTIFVGRQEIYPNDMTGIAYFSPLEFWAATDDGTRYVIGGELSLSNIRGFSAKLGANWYKDEMKNLPTGEMPAFDASLELSYSYKDKFTISAGTNITGESSFINDGAYFSATNPQSARVVNTVPTSADVFAGVEVELFNGFNVFAEGRNLANQKLYRHQFYPGLGANVMLGIKAVF